jgi:putative DNA primase/helicase
MENLTLDLQKTGGTGGTGGTASNSAASSGSATENTGGTGGTGALPGDYGIEKVKARNEKIIRRKTKAIDAAINPLHDADEYIERLSFDDLDLPCFIIKDDWFYLNSKRKPGVWYCYETESKGDKPASQIALFICSPVYIDGITNTEDGRYFGRLLRFRDTLGKWRKWAMPMELLRGSGEELRGELLAAGVEIDHKNRAHIPTYLQWRTPKEVVTAATRTGWTAKGGAFVLHDRIIGDESVHFQSESMTADGAAKLGGDYRQWQETAALCERNPVLMVSICVSLAGPLLVKVHRDSGGVHWVGDSSIGKTTALRIGASVWGGDDFKRTWRATSNGLEGAAALLSDTCLCLDEINEADPREVGAIVYSLGNGTGKTRANRIGSARQVHRWRLTLLSTGERSITAAMQEGGKQAKAGQLVRLLNIPAARKFGVFDDLHDFAGGREMADHFKTECAKHYGHAGIKFIEYIIQQGNSDFGGTLAKIEQQFPPTDGQAARAASRFALYAMAGELAIEAGIVPWKQGSALDACKVMFEQWLQMRGDGATEHKQILQAVSDYILKYGASKFTDKAIGADVPAIREQSGWYTDSLGERVYLFTSAALREAGGDYDFKRVLDALDSANWIVEHDEGKRSKKTVISGHGKVNLYWIRPAEDFNNA